jgi:Zn-dependent alcohol dehydrogenase
MSSHNAVVTTAVRAPLSILKVPTVQPIDREVLVHVEWTASTPLELHQADGGLLVKHPYVMGSNPAGTVVKVGPKVQNLVVGDKVCWGSPEH